MSSVNKAVPLRLPRKKVNGVALVAQFDPILLHLARRRNSSRKKEKRDTSSLPAAIAMLAPPRGISRKPSVTEEVHFL